VEEVGEDVRRKIERFVKVVERERETEQLYVLYSVNKIVQRIVFI
jgi:hypothetical protein